MKDIVKLTQEYVLRECKKETNIFGMNAYNHHFKSVVMYAKELAEKRNADLEIVLVSAWLHDIGSIKGEYEEHHISGQKYAEEFLKKNKYPQEKIDKVKYCIYAHRGSRDIPRDTIEEECISDADAMSHFNTVSSLFYLAINVRGLDTEEAEKFVKEKLERSYKKLSKIGKKIIQDKYDAVMELF